MPQWVKAGILCLLLCFSSGCGGSWEVPPSTSLQLAPAPTSTARMYLPQYRGTMDPAALLDRTSSTAFMQDLDPALRDQLVGELRGILESRASFREPSSPPKGSENMVPIDILPDGHGGEQLEWTYVNVGDYDQNGQVGLSDLTPIGFHFATGEGDLGWEAAQIADGDNNGEVNLGDVTPIGMHFGASCAGYSIYGRNGGAGPYTLLDTLAREEGAGGPPASFVWPISAAYEEYVVAAYDFDGDDSPVTPIIRPNVAVLESEGLSIVDRSENTITLSGLAAGISPGQVLVSGDGKGFLGIVESVGVDGGNTTVTCSQGTLEDLFDFAEIKFSRSMQYGDIKGFTPAVEGAELLPGGTIATSSAGDKYASATLPLQFKFPDKKFGDGFAIQGVIDLKLNVDFDIQMGEGWTGLSDLRYFDFSTGAEVKGTLEVKWIQSTDFVDRAWHIGSISFAPILILVGPIPVVFTPEVDLYCGVKISGEIGLECKPSLAVSAKAGLLYTEATGWDPYSDYSVVGEWGFDKPNFYGKLEAEINLFSPQPTIELYGVAGPYARLNAPYGKVAAQLQTTPPEFSIAFDLGAKAYVGADVDAFGYKLAEFKLDDPIFDVVYRVAEYKWPLFDSDLRFDIEWEAESPADYEAAGISWTPDRDDVVRPHLVWYTHTSGAWPATAIDQGAPGSMDAEPYALWTETVEKDSKGNPVSGKVTAYVGRIVNADYKVRLTTWHSWPVRINRITVSGDHSGTFTYPGDNSFYGGGGISWDPLVLDSQTGKFTQVTPQDIVDQYSSWEGYFPYFNFN